MPYTDEQLLDILRDLAGELGQAPTMLEMRACPGRPSPVTYINRFGSWRAALARLRLRPRRKPPRHTTAEMIGILQDVANELGRAPSKKEFKQLRPNGPSPSSYAYRFKSWNAALEAAGLEIRYHHTPAHDDETLLKTLHDLAGKLGRTPTMRELQAYPGLPSRSAYTRRFGNWNAALEAAGLEPNRRTLGGD